MGPDSNGVIKELGERLLSGLVAGMGRRKFKLLLKWDLSLDNKYTEWFRKSKEKEV